MSDEKRPVFDVRWESGDAECMFGAEDYEPELAARQDSVCEAADVTAVSYPGEEQPPYQAHVYLHIEEDQTVWAGVMARRDRPPTIDEIVDALVQWRTRRGHRPPTFHVTWWTE